MDSIQIAVRDKRNAELTEIVTEQQRIILALQESHATLQQQVEGLQRKLRSMETGKPKGMPGVK